ncbi:MAG: hypothetical protein RRA94_15090, partial [Bacteroidota bacterium]|nr:hypothetical protein [Bacteroidota bacterium]
MRNDYGPSAVRSVLLVAILLALTSAPQILLAQDTADEGPPYYDKVVRLRDGSVIRDVEVTWE